MSFGKITEISATSGKSFEDAIQKGVKRASKTLKNVRSVWVKDQEALVKDGKIDKYKVTMKVTFVLED